MKTLRGIWKLLYASHREIVAAVAEPVELSVHTPHSVQFTVITVTDLPPKTLCHFRNNWSLISDSGEQMQASHDDRH